MGEGVNVESIMEEATFLAGLFQQIVADCKVFFITRLFRHTLSIAWISSAFLRWSFHFSMSL